MGISEVRSPWSSDRSAERVQRATSAPGQSPSNAADSGHLVRSPGKGPAVRRRDNCDEPAMGENWDVIQDRR